MTVFEFPLISLCSVRHRICRSDCNYFKAFAGVPFRQFSVLPPGRKDRFEQTSDRSGGDAVLVVAIAAQILANFTEPILHRHRSWSPAPQPRDLRADGGEATLVLVLANQADYLVVTLAVRGETTINTFACSGPRDDEIINWEV